MAYICGLIHMTVHSPQPLLGMCTHPNMDVWWHSGKLCFLYYLLLQLLSKKSSVALNNLVISFSSAMKVSSPFLKVTWTLSNSNDKTEQPCASYLDACHQGHTWTVQMTSPKEERRKWWQKQHSPEMFIIKYPSVHKIMVIRWDSCLIFPNSHLLNPFQ